MAQGSQLRKQKKMAVKGMMKAKARSPSPTNPLEVPHLRKLEADLEQLGNAFNNNTKVYNHALTVAEMRLRVLERAMHDQLRGCVRTTMASGVISVDFEAYVQEFVWCMVMAEFAGWAKRLSEAGHQMSGKIVSPGYEDAHIFGGGP